MLRLKDIFLLLGGLSLSAIGALAVGWVYDDSFGRGFVLSSMAGFLAMGVPVCIMLASTIRANHRVTMQSTDAHRQPVSQTSPYAKILTRAGMYFCIFGGIAIAVVAFILLTAPKGAPVIFDKYTIWLGFVVGGILFAASLIVSFVEQARTKR